MSVSQLSFELEPPDEQNSEPSPCVRASWELLCVFERFLDYLFY